jgi:hypothetical protein
MKRELFLSPLALVLLVCGLPAKPAEAQTGAAMRLTPMRTPWEFRGNWALSGEGEVDGAGDEADLHQYNAGIRWREDPADRQSLSAGFVYEHVEILTTSPLLPDRLVDFDAGVGLGLGEAAGWSFEGVVGAGYAGVSPFSDARAIYFKADLIATHAFDEEGVMTLHLALSHDGNRVIFPDLPLPAAAFVHRVSPEFTYVVGFPANSVRWTPVEELRLELSIFAFSSVAATVEFELAPGIWVFALTDSSTHGYRLDIEDFNRRLFLSQSRGELGVRFEPTDQVAVEAAVGYSWDREFERGFDLRDTTSVAELSDEPYIRFGLRFGF